MSEMTRPGETSNGRRYPSTPCGAGFPPVLPLTPVGNRQEPYDRDELSYAESARLTRATMAAEAAIVAARDGIREAHRRLVTAWHRGETAVRRVEEYAAGHRHGEAGRSRRRVLDRHAGDGAEDRRARPRWLSWWLVWPLILISAAYDTAFFAETFQTALDVPEDAPAWQNAISYIPGFGIAMALILCGSWLAVPLLRHRNRAERRPTRGRLDWPIVLSRTFRRWRPAVESRRPGDLPWPSWPLPVAFLLALVGVMGTWAWLRGGDLLDQRLRGPLAALLVLLTVSAIAFKASAHNPFQDPGRRVAGRAGQERPGADEAGEAGPGRAGRAHRGLAGLPRRGGGRRGRFAAPCRAGVGRDRRRAGPARSHRSDRPAVRLGRRRGRDLRGAAAGPGRPQPRAGRRRPGRRAVPAQRARGAAERGPARGDGAAEPGHAAAGR
ncbi:hypothetical protein ACQPZJ_26890 [Actinoplanes sp. CA-054009]